MNYQNHNAMKLFFPYTKEELDKIGNAIIYLAQQITPLSKTKLLKLLYLVEETSVKKYGLPLLNLRFLVWKFGPVAKDIFIDLSSSRPVLLDEYISREEREDTTFIFPKMGFCDDEFSDNEMQVLEFVVQTFKHSSAEDLVKLTHREHSLWHQTAKENGVLEYLENESINNTEIEIDFSQLLEGNSLKHDLFLQQKDYIQTSRSLKF